MSNKGTHFMKLLEWIPIDKLDWHWLVSSNPNAIHLLEKNWDKVDWGGGVTKSNSDSFIGTKLG